MRYPLIGRSVNADEYGGMAWYIFVVGTGVVISLRRRSYHLAVCGWRNANGRE